jgi:hypothetical protein
MGTPQFTVDFTSAEQVRAGMGSITIDTITLTYSWQAAGVDHTFGSACSEHRAVQESPLRKGKGEVIAGYATAKAVNHRANHRTLCLSVNRNAVAHRSLGLADRREAYPST